MIDNNGKELASLQDRVVKVEKVGGGSTDTLALKLNLVEFKKVTSLQATDLSTFFNWLDDKPLKVDVAAILYKEFTVDVPGDGREEK